MGIDLGGSEEWESIPDEIDDLDEFENCYNEYMGYNEPPTIGSIMNESKVRKLNHKIILDSSESSSVTEQTI